MQFFFSAKRRLPSHIVGAILFKFYPTCTLTRVYRPTNYYNNSFYYYYCYYYFYYKSIMSSSSSFTEERLSDYLRVYSSNRSLLFDAIPSSICMYSCICIYMSYITYYAQYIVKSYIAIYIVYFYRCIAPFY